MLQLNAVVALLQSRELLDIDAFAAFILDFVEHQRLARRVGLNEHGLHMVGI